MVETSASSSGVLSLSSSCFAGDYGTGQTDTVIITPASGKWLIVKQVYASTADSVGDITLKFTGASQPFFKLYTKTKTEAVGNVICAEGAIDQTIDLTCPAKSFVSIAYDEV